MCQGSCGHTGDHSYCQLHEPNFISVPGYGYNCSDETLALRTLLVELKKTNAWLEKISKDVEYLMNNQG